MDRFNSAEPEVDTRRCECGHIAEDHCVPHVEGLSSGPGFLGADMCSACFCQRFAEPADLRGTEER